MAPKPELIRIKTLEEIKQEKAAKSQNQKDSSKTIKLTKRVVTVKDGKAFSEILQAKKDEQQPGMKMAEQTVMGAPGRNQQEPDPSSAPLHPKPNNVEKVRVKTLEEIRREKAARLQAQQAVPCEAETSCDPDGVLRRQRLLSVKKLPSSKQKNRAASSRPADSS